MENMQNGIIALEQYRKAGKLDLPRLLKIAQEYRFGFYKIVDYVPGFVEHKMKVLKEYGGIFDGENLDVVAILQLLIDNPAALKNKKLTNYEILMEYMGNKSSLSESEVNRRITIHDKLSEIKANSLLRDMAEAVELSNCPLKHDDDDELNP